MVPFPVDLPIEALQVLGSWATGTTQSADKLWLAGWNVEGYALSKVVVGGVAHFNDDQVVSHAEAAVLIDGALSGKQVDWATLLKWVRLFLSVVNTVSSVVNKLPGTEVS